MRRGSDRQEEKVVDAPCKVGLEENSKPRARDPEVQVLNVSQASLQPWPLIILIHLVSLVCHSTHSCIHLVVGC